jgi:hypothetical protein
METLLQAHQHPDVSTVPSDQLAKLVCKLRWIGLEEEARPLQTALGRIPSSERKAVLADPPQTD